MNTLKKVLIFPIWLLAKIYYVFLRILVALVPIALLIEIFFWIRGD